MIPVTNRHHAGWRQIKVQKNMRPWRRNKLFTHVPQTNSKSWSTAISQRVRGADVRTVGKTSSERDSIVRQASVAALQASPSRKTRQCLPINLIFTSIPATEPRSTHLKSSPRTGVYRVSTLPNSAQARLNPVRAISYSPEPLAPWFFQNPCVSTPVSKAR